MLELCRYLSKHIRSQLYRNITNRSLTASLLQGNLAEHTEVSVLRHTVGHVEVEALRDHQLVLCLLILPSTQ